MDNKEFKFEEFKIVVGIGKDYFGFYFRSMILYFAIMGVLLKLFLDFAPHSNERLVVFIVGQIISVGSIAGTLAVYPKYMLVANRCKELAAELSIPDVYFPGTIRVAKGFVLGLIIMSAAWAFLFMIA